MKKLIVAGATVLAVMSASLSPAFASTLSSGTSTSTGGTSTVTSSGLREIW